MSLSAAYLATTVRKSLPHQDAKDPSIYIFPTIPEVFEASHVALDALLARCEEAEERASKEREARKATESVNAYEVVRARTNLEAHIESERTRAETAETRVAALEAALRSHVERGHDQFGELSAVLNTA